MKKQNVVSTNKSDLVTAAKIVGVMVAVIAMLLLGLAIVSANQITFGVR